jgi:membrane associated rhomboid family serine protease
MFPLSDDNSDRHTTPYVNYLIVLANVVVFVLFQQLGANEAFDHAFSAVPQEILSGHDVTGTIEVAGPAGAAGNIKLYPTPVSVYLTLFTSMFMHGGFAHIGGNMLYLWIFGDNLEHAMGHLRYLGFYLLCGVLAGLSHVFVSQAMGANLYIPCLGASGAISGVMGGYITLYPTRRVTVMAFRQIMEVPAYVALGSWILFQLIDSFGFLGSESGGGGVAYAAHIGGFIAGVVLVHLFAQKSRMNNQLPY